MLCIPHHLAAIGFRAAKTIAQQLSFEIERLNALAQDHCLQVDNAKTAFQSLLMAEAAMAAHSKAVQDMQIGYQPPTSNTEETDFESLLRSATERHTIPK